MILGVNLQKDANSGNFFSPQILTCQSFPQVHRTNNCCRMSA